MPNFLQVMTRASCLLNSIDIYFRGGLYPATFPFILGQEAAGVVVAVHPSVKDRCKLGSRVAVPNGDSYAEYVKTNVSTLAVSHFQRC